MSAWIKMIPDEEADEALRDVLQLARTPHGTVDNVSAGISSHTGNSSQVFEFEDEDRQFEWAAEVSHYNGRLNADGLPDPFCCVFAGSTVGTVSD